MLLQDGMAMDNRSREAWRKSLCQEVCGEAITEIQDWK